MRPLKLEVGKIYVDRRGRKRLAARIVNNPQFPGTHMQVELVKKEGDCGLPGYLDGYRLIDSGRCQTSPDSASFSESDLVAEYKTLRLDTGCSYMNGAGEKVILCTMLVHTFSDWAGRKYDLNGKAVGPHWPLVAAWEDELLPECKEWNPKPTVVGPDNADDAPGVLTERNKVAQGIRNRDIYRAVLNGKTVQRQDRVGGKEWYCFSGEGALGELAQQRDANWRIKPEPIVRWIGVWSNGDLGTPTRGRPFAALGASCGDEPFVKALRIELDPGSLNATVTTEDV